MKLNLFFTSCFLICFIGSSSSILAENIYIDVTSPCVKEYTYKKFEGESYKEYYTQVDASKSLVFRTSKNDQSKLVGTEDVAEQRYACNNLTTLKKRLLENRPEDKLYLITKKDAGTIIARSVSEFYLVGETEQGIYYEDREVKFLYPKHQKNFAQRRAVQNINTKNTTTQVIFSNREVLNGQGGMVFKFNKNGKEQYLTYVSNLGIVQRRARGFVTTLHSVNGAELNLATAAKPMTVATNVTLTEEEGEPMAGASFSFAQADSFHTVVSGDNLYLLSKKYNITVENIKEWNDLESDLLDRGMKLRVVSTGELKAMAAMRPITQQNGNYEETIHIVKHKEILQTIARDYNTTVEKIGRYNNITDFNKINIGQRLVVARRLNKVTDAPK